MIKAENELAKKVIEFLPWVEEKFKIFKKESHDLKIDCLSNIGTYTMAVTIPNIKRKIAHKIPFYHKCIRNVSVSSFPILPMGDEAIERDEKGCVFNPRKLPSSSEQFLITIDFDLPKKSLDALVDTRTEREALKTEDTYWIHAQIKNPTFVTNFFDRMNIYDLEVEVLVRIINDIKVSLPSYVTEMIDVSRDLLEEMEIHRKEMLMRKQNALQHKYKDKVSMERIRKLGKYCTPGRFERYVIVHKPFQYDFCEPGKYYFEKINISPIPETMKVYSSTDLGKKRLAAKGKLVYKKRDFREGIVKMFA